MRKLPSPPAVEIAFTERDLIVLQDALEKYSEFAIPRLLEGEIKHLTEIEQRFARAREVLNLEEGAIAMRAGLRETP